MNLARHYIPPQTSAFTLMELMVSSAVMSLVVGAAYLCLESGFRSQRLIESRTDVIQTARVAMELMANDLRAACPLSRDFEFVGMSRVLGDVEADNMDFATHRFSPRLRGEGDWCEVSYFVDQLPNDERFGLWRRRDPAPDPEPLDGGSRELIIEGVLGVRFEYTEGYYWYDEWGSTEPLSQQASSSLLAGNLTGMPEAVRITLMLDPTPASGRRAAVGDNRDDDDDRDPPLIFRTVVPLHLAGRPQMGGGGAGGEAENGGSGGSNAAGGSDG